MGAYADHGVEYHIVKKDGKHIIIASTCATDQRLLDSIFFSKCNEEWLSIDAMYRGDYIKRIDDPDFDVKLNDKESIILESALSVHGDDILEHGWYDVNRISYNY